MQALNTRIKQPESKAYPGALSKRAAQYLRQTFGYLQQNSVSEIANETNRVIRRFPEHVLLAAAIEGILLGVVLWRL